MAKFRHTIDSIKLSDRSAMGKSQLAVRIPQVLHDKLNSYVERTGTSKTDLVMIALATYLACAENVPLSQRVAELERRMVALEIKARES